MKYSVRNFAFDFSVFAVRGRVARSAIFEPSFRGDFIFQNGGFFIIHILQGLYFDFLFFSRF